MKSSLLILTAALCLLMNAPAPAAEKPELWFYQAANLSKDNNIARLEKLWHRAAAAGYKHVMLNDSKFDSLRSLRDPHYLANIQKVKRIAAACRLDVVPELMAVGYSNALLENDPNLAEGLPVKDALFVVHNGQAQLQADPPISLGKMFHDDDVTVEDGTATIGAHEDHARIYWSVPCAPFRCYHISINVKSDNFTGEHPEIKPIGAGVTILQYQNVNFKPTQDWTRTDVIFNSLDNKNIMLYIGVWGPNKGTLQIKDWSIEEIGLTNVLRRPGAPCVVKSDDGRKTYVEGSDYEPIRDPKMGMSPYAGEYQSYHASPPIITRLPEGTRLRVSWYHPAIIMDDQVCACFNAPKTMQILAEDAKLMKAAFGAGGYMMAHDEIRVMGWDESCEATHKDPGQMLADDVRYCTRLLQGSRVYAWSDMFDPYHNAHDHYFLVNGDLKGSWEGLDPSVTIMNWNFHQNEKSMKFFADAGHKQIIAGYYDSNVEGIKKWLATTKKVQGIVGVMYTTWGNNYGDLERFAKIVNDYPY